ncbi:hypothetical protein, partial [Mangrovihabitans endophyticus]|uniref:hypothetical protein n=1 Tax=Mangrovihabitans endophyticus TaxID=1751298 RepID=UPI00402B977D
MLDAGGEVVESLITLEGSQPQQDPVPDVGDFDVAHHPWRDRNLVTANDTSAKWFSRSSPLEGPQRRQPSALRPLHESLITPGRDRNTVMEVVGLKMRSGRSSPLEDCNVGALLEREAMAPDRSSSLERLQREHLGSSTLPDFASHRTVGGWHLASGLPKPTEQVAVAGSVYRLRCSSPPTSQALAALAHH